MMLTAEGKQDKEEQEAINNFKKVNRRKVNRIISVDEHESRRRAIRKAIR